VSEEKRCFYKDTPGFYINAKHKLQNVLKFSNGQWY